MHCDIFTLFPGMFQGPLTESILKRAQDKGLLSIALHNIRDATTDKHHIVDDYPYGGGAGMVMKPDPIFAAIEPVYQGGPIILLTPQGRLFSQQIAAELAQQPRLTLLCGHYEGVDERVIEHLVTDELSIGDYVLTGGELAAMVVVDAVARLIPGVVAGKSVQENRIAAVCSNILTIRAHRSFAAGPFPMYYFPAITNRSPVGGAKNRYAAPANADPISSPNST